MVLKVFPVFRRDTIIDENFISNHVKTCPSLSKFSKERTIFVKIFT